MDSRRIAVVTAGGLVEIFDLDGGHEATANIRAWGNLGECAQWATANRVRAVYLTEPGVQHNPGWWEALPDPWRATSTGPAGVQPATVALVKMHYLSKRGVMVYDLTRDTRWGPLRDEPDAAGLFRAVTEFESAMGGTPATYSPGHMALALMAPDKAAHPEWFNHPELPRRFPRYASGQAHRIEPKALEAGEWLHVWDVNAAYLAAAQSVDLGCGTLDHFEARNLVPNNHPGIYRVEVNTRTPAIERPGWYDRALVKQAGAGVEVAEVWSFSEKHQALRPWVARLWDARERTTGTARALVKAAYTAALGRLDMRPVGAGTNADYRPLWWTAIVGETSRRMYARWSKAAATEGWSPLFIWADTLAVVTDDPDHEHLFVPIYGLGSLRHTHSYRLADHPDLLAPLKRGNTVDALRYMGATDGT